MKIAFFTDTFLPQLNGVVVCVIETAKKLADRGHEVYIIAPKFSKSEEFKYPNVTVIRRRGVPFPIYEGYKFTLPFDPSLLKFVVDKKIGIIHFHTPLTLGMQAVIIAKMLNLPLVGTFHTFFMDPQYLKHVNMNYRIVEKFGWNFSNFYYNRCNRIICHSESVKSELAAHGCKKPIKLMPLGIDSSVFDNTNSAAVRKSLNKNGKILLFIGRLAYEKNIPYLLECFVLVLKDRPATKLVIVGDGPQENDIKEKINALGIGKSVVLLGRIEHDTLVKSGIFGACDVFVTASTTETGPLTVIEAQANGLVCVGVKGRGMNLIKNSVNGYILDPDDREGFAKAVVKLLTDDATYKRMKSATLKMVHKYELSQIVSELEKVYESVSIRH